jgi:hypothetical protein
MMFPPFGFLEISRRTLLRRQCAAKRRLGPLDPRHRLRPPFVLYNRDGLDVWCIR